MRISVRALGPWLISSALLGCSSGATPCEQACDEANACGRTLDCSTFCGRKDGIYSTAACTTPANSLFNCYLSHDVCSPDVLNDCGDEINSLQACVQPYCNAQPSDGGGCSTP